MLLTRRLVATKLNGVAKSVTRNPKYPLRNQVALRALGATALVKNLRCLDVGSGDSPLAMWLDSLGCEVVALTLEGGEHLRSITSTIRVLPADILRTSADDIGHFDRVFLSLVSLYLPAKRLEQLWQVVASLLRPGAAVVSVDLHPCSKLQKGVPWREVREYPDNYWEGRRLTASVVNKGHRETTQYYHHTFEELCRGPLKQELRLTGLQEFPQRMQRRCLTVPAYLLTTWSYTNRRSIYASRS